MKLIIDGMPITAQPEWTLRDMLAELGLLTGKLSTDPLAARIAGEVFTLNYIPLRLKDTGGESPTSARLCWHPTAR